MNERDLKLRERESNMDQVDKLQADLDEQKNMLSQKRGQLERAQLDKENLIKQMHDVSYYFKCVEEAKTG